VSSRPRKRKPVKIPARKRGRKNQRTTSDYLLLEIPENQDLFGVQRKAVGPEQYLSGDIKNKHLGVVYTTITYLVSPFFNYDTQRPGESCTCLAWRQRHRRCIHLKKFYELNPEVQWPDIFEDTTLPVDEIAEAVAQKTLEASAHDPQGVSPTPENKRRLAKELADFANDWYRHSTEFREKLNPFRKCSQEPDEEEQEIALLQFERTLRRWAKDHGMSFHAHPENPHLNLKKKKS
jgi:hypothetical protein